MLRRTVLLHSWDTLNMDNSITGGVKPEDGELFGRIEWNDSRKRCVVRLRSEPTL